MIHAKLVYMLIVLMSGVVALSIAGSIYRRRGKRLLLDYGGFLLSLLLILCSFLPELYLLAGATVSERTVSVLSWIFMAAGSSLYVWIAPGFYYRLLGIRPTAALRRVGVVVAGIFELGVVAFFAFRFSDGIAIALNSILFAMVAYGIILIGFNVGRITDGALRRALMVFLVLSAGFFPLMYFDSLVLSSPRPLGLKIIDGLALPTYLLCINVAGAFFAFRYLDRPPYIADGSLTPEFTSRYAITPREKEIIEGLLVGSKTKELAEQLFISSKTVENHVYNIYRKTEVANRVQLFTLIQANRGD